MPAVAVLLLWVTGPGCGRPQLTARDAATVARGAMAEAGLEGVVTSNVRRSEVETPEGVQPDAWLVDVETREQSPRRLTLAVHPTAGRVIATFEPSGAQLDPTQVQAVSRYQRNPRADRRRPGLVAGGVLAGAAILATAYALLRYGRWREEQHAQQPSESI